MSNEPLPLPTNAIFGGGSVPDGTAIDDILKWDGTEWVPVVNDLPATPLRIAPYLGITPTIPLINEGNLYKKPGLDGLFWNTIGGGEIDLTVGGGGGDHGLLAGLGDDDHTQYLLVNGTRSMSGTLNLNLNDITNVGVLSTADLQLSGTSIIGLSAGGITLNPAAGGEVLITANPIAALAIAPKQYVDAVASGLDIKQSVRVKTDTQLTFITAGAGIGKTLTNNGVQAALTIDGILLNIGDRVLVDQIGTDGNAMLSNISCGIYTVTNVGSGITNWVLTRAVDFDENTDISAGSFTFIEEGVVFGGNGFVVITPDPIVMDITSTAWSQFSGGGQITASNVGVGGVGVFVNKVGNDLQFKNIAAADSTITIVNNGLQNQIDLSVNVANIDHGLLTGLGDDDHVQYLLIDGTRAMTGPLQLPAGNAGAPAMTFSGDTNMGIYRLGADILGMATSGVHRFTVDADGHIGTTTTPRFIDPSGINLSLPGGPLFGLDTRVINFENVNSAPEFLILTGDGSGAAPVSSGIVFVDKAGLPNQKILAMIYGALNGYGMYLLDDTGMPVSSPFNLSLTTNENFTMSDGFYFNSQTGGIKPPSMSTVVRDAMLGVSEGMIIYNDTTNRLEGYESGVWEELSGGGAVVFPLYADPIGTAVAPAYSFILDTDTGMYSDAAGEISFSSDANKELSITSTGLKIRNGTSTNPSYSFLNEPTVGMYVSGNTGVNFAASGSKIAEITTAGFKGASGTVNAPSYSFNLQPGIGMYVNGPNGVNFAAGGVDITSINTSGITMPPNMIIQNQPGTVASPTYTFASDSDTGMYRPAVGTIGFTSNGTATATLGATDLTLASNVAFKLTEPLGGTNTITLQAPTALPGSYILTLPLNDGVVGEVLTTDGNGGLSWSIGSADNLGNHTATQNLNLDTFSIVSSINGTAAAPTYTVGAAGTEGIYKSVFGGLAMAVGGVERFNLDSSQLNLPGIYHVIPEYSSFNPSFSFQTELGTGMGYDGTSLFFRRNNVDILTMNIAGTSRLYTPLIVPDGTVSAPGIGFASNNNSGLYNTGIGSGLRIAIEGTARVGINGNGMFFMNGTEGLSGIKPGDATNRAITFSSNVGVYAPLNQFIISLASNQADYEFLSDSLRGKPGTFAAPGYSFTADTNTGMYRIGADRLGFSTGGFHALEIASDQGIVVGAPVGGSLGSGTINAQAVYDDNVLLTDYVFEKYYDGKVVDLDHIDYTMKTLDEEIEYTKNNKHLSTIMGRNEWNVDGKPSIGKLAQQLWETIETQFLYIAELKAELTELKASIKSK